MSANFHEEKTYVVSWNDKKNVTQKILLMEHQICFRRRSQNFVFFL
jgi:hypothetical protein